MFYFLLSLSPPNCVVHFKLHRVLDALAPVGNVAPNAVVEERLVQVNLSLFRSDVVDQR